MSLSFTGHFSDYDHSPMEACLTDPNTTFDECQGLSTDGPNG